MLTSPDTASPTILPRGTTLSVQQSPALPSLDSSEGQASATTPPSLPLSPDVYHQWLLDHVDELDFGDDRDGDPKHRPTSATLLKHLRGEGRPSGITLDMAAAHLQRTLTVHTKPLKGAKRVWVQLDIDAHKDQVDAILVAVFLERLFPDLTYREPSTSGTGWHLYLWVHPGHDLRRHNEDLARCERWLTSLLRHLEYQSTVEIKHRFTLLNRNKTEIKRGQMAKAPRFPQGQLAFERFTCLPITTVASIGKTLKQLCKQEGVRLGGGRRYSSPMRSPIARGLDVIGATDRGSGAASQTIQVSAKKEVALSADDVVPDPSPFVRMQRVCRAFQDRFRHNPTLEELLKSYAQVFGGNEDERRRQRAKDVLRWAEAHFDPSLAGWRSFVSQRERLMKLVSAIPESVHRHRSVKYPHPLHDEDLAIGLYTAERTALDSTGVDADNRYSMAIGSISQMFHVLHQAGDTRRRCGYGKKPNRHKEQAIRQVLLLAGLIVYLDRGNYIPGHVGVKRQLFFPTDDN